MMTGERFPSSGNAFINGHSIRDDQMGCRRYVGFCPQFDALFDLLTAREHLKFYGNVKGLKGEVLEEQIQVLLDALSLRPFENRRAGTYSGGNKRKLSVAIAMIGNPPVVFLDEPSTGMEGLQQLLIAFHLYIFQTHTHTKWLHRHGSSIEKAHVEFYFENHEWSMRGVDHTQHGRV